MGKYTTNKLLTRAQKLEARINDSTNTDDPRWLRRRVERLRCWALRKEEAIEHKEYQRRLKKAINKRKREEPQDARP